MALIHTIHGDIEETQLARTTGFEDRPTEFVVWVEWRLGNELVRRDAHVILKQPSEGADIVVGLQGVAATSAVGGFGGE